MQCLVSNLLTPEQRSAVIAEATAWVTARTPYIPHAKVKGLGCDCATFILCVYRDLGMVKDVDLGAYSIQAHLHKPLNEEHAKLLRQYEDTIRRFADEIPESEAQAGDMVLFKVARSFAHGGIIIQATASEHHPAKMNLHIVHAEIKRGVVHADVENDPHLRGCQRKFFRRNFSKS